MEQLLLEELKCKLDSRSAQERLAALKLIKEITPRRTKSSGLTNNHVHSTYSFSPYSPSRIIYEAYMSGLDTVGIMDHDSVGGAKEFIAAGRIFGIVTTVGFEIRTDWSDTPFKNRRLNNPDQIGNAYMCIHGLPNQMIDIIAAFLAPIQAARNDRNRAMVARINAGFPNIALSFEEDVIPLSMNTEGGSITERHILFALALKLMKKIGSGNLLADFFEDILKIDLSEKQRMILMDESYAYYAYDVLNILKSGFISDIFIPANPPETPPVKDLIAFCRDIGAITGYAYLGDVSASPTGDKKAQVFEDAYLDELFDYLKTLGVDAVAYMPSRNTPAQLKRVMALCDKNGLFQISGEDINQPRQSFICEQLRTKAFTHLIEATWALVGHERKATQDKNLGMFSSEQTNVPLNERIQQYAAYGRAFRVEEQ